MALPFAFWRTRDGLLLLSRSYSLSVFLRASVSPHEAIILAAPKSC